ncbi:hypothetical protein MMC15_005280 [Xylographa vitiligo]|nr:hypothetical protein [Xylographa vitiligo]
MPRPKRSKIVPSAPRRENFRAPSSRILKAVSLPHSSSCDTTNSDDSEGLITTIKRNTKSQYTAFEEISMSGALASDDLKDSTRLRPSHGKQRAALSRFAREADHVHAIEGLKKRRDEALAKERASKMDTQVMKLQVVQDEVLVPSSMPRAEEIAQREPEKGDEYLLHFESSAAERVKPAPFSTCKLLATPSAESSMLALANFKRRPRQPSILQIGRQDNPALETELDDVVDDFQPDEESTPFYITRLGVTSQPIPIHPANTPLSTSSSLERQIPSSRKRKLTSPRVQVPNSQSSPDRLSSSPPQRAEKQASHLHTSPEARLHDSDPDLPSNESRAPHAETIWSDIMAPPDSSSPPQSPGESITIQKIRFKRSDANRKRKQRRASTFVPSKSISQPLKSISTATLQNLLPRRHHRPVKRASGYFDIQESSDVELDTPEVAEDQVSFATSSGRRKVITQKRKPMKLMKPVTTVKKRQPGKTAQRAHSQEDGKGTSVVRTYSRCLSDKENINADSDRVRLDESIDSPLSTISHNLSAQSSTENKDGAMPAKARTELKTLAKKFKEVDKWEMEFEEVTASSSSPWDAR